MSKYVAHPEVSIERQAEQSVQQAHFDPSGCRVEVHCAGIRQDGKHLTEVPSVMGQAEGLRKRIKRYFNGQVHVGPLMATHGMYFFYLYVDQAQLGILAGSIESYLVQQIEHATALIRANASSARSATSSELGLERNLLNVMASLADIAEHGAAAIFIEPDINLEVHLSGPTREELSAVAEAPRQALFVDGTITAIGRADDQVRLQINDGSFFIAPGVALEEAFGYIREPTRVTAAVSYVDGLQVLENTQFFPVRGLL